ncbi:MAG: GTP diphosphokinase [Chloroflexi bacterium]|nr:GTP diphosphokinase [Chloroflexota bacterium]
MGGTVSTLLSFEDLIAPLTSTSIHDRRFIKRAYEFGESAHAGQKRKSGEDYFVHCVEVARIMVDLHMDSATIAAALLHDVVEDTSVTLEELEQDFSEDVAHLVAGVTKLDQFPLHEHTSKSQREAEYLRKTLLAMNQDVRVILIKLADRLHNMRTLGYMSPESQQRNAQETMDIFAPLASRLGIWQMKWELEDLAFRYLNPEKYRMIASLIDERRAERDKYVAKLVERLESMLKAEGIGAEVSGRSKHIYSIWRKMDRKDVGFDSIFDVRAVRVMVDSVTTCYQALGLIHNTWRPITGEFDDYIAAPKDNFYQSLHTAVILEDGKTLEVQIRTYEMHAHAEYGVAAHWKYKESGLQSDQNFERRLQHLRELMDVGRNVDDATEYLDALRTDVFQDRVYAFTPRGDIIDLPAGATPIDFAYHIHTDIGHRCRGAKVNGKLVSLDYVLQVGDRVEVLTARRGGPSRDWLNPNHNFVKTKRAVAKIRHWFRRQDRDKMIVLGREMLDRELKRLGVDQRVSHDQVASLFDVNKTDDLLAQIGFGDIHPQHIATKILELEQREAERKAEEENRIPLSMTPSPPRKTSKNGSKGVAVQGAGDFLTVLARCCNPAPGDPIVGYITRGRGVSVHREDCSNILNCKEPERLIEVTWGDTDTERYVVPVCIKAYDRKGLMRDIGTVVAEEQINMLDVNVRTVSNVATFNLTMEIETAAQLSRLLSKMERLPNVIEAKRVGA